MGISDNAKGGAKRGGWTRPDDTVRCKNTSCYTGTTETGDKVRPPLSRSDVWLRREEGPNVRIAIVDRCEYCGDMARVFVMKGYAALTGEQDESRARIRLIKCISQTRLLSFGLTELKAGTIDGYVAPAAIPERENAFVALRPTGGYNPDEYTEPRYSQESMI